MSMRNHWINIKNTSLKNDYATGPRSKQDEMEIDLFQDDQGASVHILKVDCFPRTDSNGDLKICTRVVNKLTEEIVFYHETYRNANK